MRRRTVLTAALALTLACPPAVACAYPAAPQSDSPCSAELTGAMTRPQGQKMAQRCEAGQWQTLAAPAPPGDRWVSFGPTVTLHGQGMRNPDVTAGRWTAEPLDAATTCRAVQQTVVSPGELSPPQPTEAPPGEPLTFEIGPRLFTVELSGNCLWSKQD